MKAKAFRIPLLIAALSIAANISLLQAAPSLPITEPPVTSTFMDGPNIDPNSTNGQWFLSLEGIEEYRTHEFHDNLMELGGGQKESFAIFGAVVSIQYAAGGSGGYGDDIVGFKIEATIANDTHTAMGEESFSDNSHSESRQPGSGFYVGTLVDTKLTAEFAIADISLLPNTFDPPYRQLLPYIIADNEDQRAWYCWNPLEPPNGSEAGKYYVPTWDFGDIPLNQLATRTLAFVVDPPMDSSDPRYDAIYASLGDGIDIFANRTTSLKISTWIDNLEADSGDAYPDEVLRSSDVSVFHNEAEPYIPTHKMHWPQLPDPNGWDVRACNGNYNPDDGLQKVLADDFRCTSNGPITRITFWGSFKDDEYEDEEGSSFHGITNIHLSLHHDIPAGELAQYSMPKLPAIWKKDFNPENPPAGWEITITPEVPSSQGWYDPNTGQVMPENHMDYFRYEVTIPESEAFVQTEGTIYWLDISVITRWQTWGWKTSRSQHFNDDAVWADMPVTNQLQWQELIDPVTEESLDLAFVIDGGGGEPQPDEFDWGDAPDPTYPTLAANMGANHLIPGGSPLALRLGWLIDGELDGQPDPTATGDDLANLADEDGVVFNTPLIPGTVAQVTVYAGVNTAASGFARLQGWIDFNADGMWGPAEKIFSDQIVTFSGLANPTVLTFPVPGGAMPGPTFARFRLSTATGLSPVGSAPDGEVEDYMVDIFEPQEVDWGDAYDNFMGMVFPTLKMHNGAHHVIVRGMFLGAGVDPEPDGQPAPPANGDDTNLNYSGIPYPPGDEDGVVFTSLLQPGGYASVNVVASMSGILDAWIDFNNDGDWADSGEQIFTLEPLNAGTNALLFPVPVSAFQGSPVVSRFRYSGSGVASYAGLAVDGEVEDYLVDIEHVEPQGIDFGDAPGPTYPTLLPLGARHPIVAGVGLGAMIDAEPDGQPTFAADGDDNANFDDEDGVTFVTSLVVGSNATVNVVAGVLGGYLDAWIDFDQSGSFDASEHIPPGGPVPVPPGLNVISFTVPTPPTAKLGPTFARFRITSVPGGLAPGGAATDGEVEDYAVEILQPRPTIGIVITNLSFNSSWTVAKVEWTAQSGITYQMQATTNLMVSNSWGDVEAPVLGPVNWQTNNMSAQTNKFYRVTAPWTP